MSKSPDAFRSIGEVSRLVGVAPHVLRYWEGQFTQLSPVKRADGRRYYRPDDVRLIAGLCQVLREEGLSIRGAKRLITADRGAGLRAIGKARLGENPTSAPAVRLAAPDMPPEAENATLPEAVDVKPEKAARIKRRPAAAGDSLPLFPELASIAPNEWLSRLAATAARLRSLSGVASQAELRTLRARIPAQE